MATAPALIHPRSSICDPLSCSLSVAASDSKPMTRSVVMALSRGLIGDYQTPTRRSLALHSSPFAPLPLPLITRAPFLRLQLNRSRDRANASFTNSLLPITAPSVKYIRMNIRNVSHSRSSNTNRRSTTRERTGRLRPNSKQPPEVEAADSHGLNGVKSNSVVNHRLRARILPTRQPS
jgi:hypothetical protein